MRGLLLWCSALRWRSRLTVLSLTSKHTSGYAAKADRVPGHIEDVVWRLLHSLRTEYVACMPARDTASGRHVCVDTTKGAACFVSILSLPSGFLVTNSSIPPGGVSGDPTAVSPLFSCALSYVGTLRADDRYVHRPP